MKMNHIKIESTSKILTLVIASCFANLAFADTVSDVSAERIERLEASVSALETRISILEGTLIPSQSNSPKPKATGGWKDKANWRLLSKGMTKNQVRAILGEAEKVDASGPIENWRWNYPMGPNVTFYDDVLYGWDEQ